MFVVFDKIIFFDDCHVGDIGSGCIGAVAIGVDILEIMFNFVCFFEEFVKDVFGGHCCGEGCIGIGQVFGRSDNIW